MASSCLVRRNPIEAHFDRELIVRFPEQMSNNPESENAKEGYGNH
jgi:hypothetical protein